MRLREGKERELQERYEIARWVCFNILSMNPYVESFNKPKTVTAYARFRWERPTVEEAEAMKAKCGVSQEEADALNKIFDEIHKRNAQR